MAIDIPIVKMTEMMIDVKKDIWISEGSLASSINFARASNPANIKKNVNRDTRKFGAEEEDEDDIIFIDSRD
jgi:hypothetical protein